MLNTAQLLKSWNLIGQLHPYFLFYSDFAQNLATVKNQVSKRYDITGGDLVPSDVEKELLGTSGSQGMLLVALENLDSLAGPV